MKILNLLLLIAFLLVSCTPAATAISTSTSAQTVTPAPTATQTPSPTPTIVPTPTPIGGGSGKIIFELNKAAFGKLFPELTGDVNFFTSNPDGTDLTPITNELKGNYSLEGISPDGHKILILFYQSSSEDLYMIDLGSENKTPLKLASRLFTQFAMGPVAKWVDNEKIVFLANGKDGRGIYIVNSDGTNLKKISQNAAPDAILSVDSTKVYWHNFVKENFRDYNNFLYAYGNFDSLWWTNLDGSGDGKLESNGKQIITDGWHRYAFSPNGNSIAWIPAEQEPHCGHSEFDVPWINDGTYTAIAGETAPGVFNKKDDEYGKTIDWAYVDAYVPRCFIMYIASLSQIDNPTKVSLMPPSELLIKDFSFSREYDLFWSSDGSQLLLFNNGYDTFSNFGPHAPILYHIDPTDKDPKLIQVLHYLFSQDSAGKFSVLGLSLDGQQLILNYFNQNPNIKFLNLQNFTYVTYFGNNPNLNNNINFSWLP